MQKKIVSLNALTYGYDEERTLYFLESDEDTPQEQYENNETGKLVMEYFYKVLTPIEQQIIIFRYGIYDGKKRTLTEIGSLPQINLSYQGVAKIEKRALEKLKNICIRKGILEKNKVL